MERWYYAVRGPPREGLTLLDEAWDTLVILDACRYDTFESVATLPGVTTKRRSRAPSTVEFLRENFAGTTLTDTVYVTANPQLYRMQEGLHDIPPLDCTFYDTVEVWQQAWDDRLNTVRPEAVTEAAITAHETYPAKRLIVHYLQPHAPFIGPMGRREIDAGRLNLWTAVRRGEVTIDIDLARRAYEENLEVALDSVGMLLNRLDGKSVITSDHGELLGERTGPIPTRKFGHPRGLYVSELLDVPWYEHPFDERRSIERGDPIGTTTQVDEATIVERLERLGYVS